jgi:hypothetical protein
MRFLIAFLLCYTIQLQHTHATGLYACAPKKFQIKYTKSPLTFKGGSPLKQSSAFSRDFMEQRCASQQQNHIRISLNCDFPTSLKVPNFQAVYQYLGKFKLSRKLNYSFIFNFLYPKHAFW